MRLYKFSVTENGKEEYQFLFALNLNDANNFRNYYGNYDHGGMDENLFSRIWSQGGMTEIDNGLILNPEDMEVIPFSTNSVSDDYREFSIGDYLKEKDFFDALSLGLFDYEYPDFPWGEDHHPNSIRIYKFLQRVDFDRFGDALGWKCGGDGDNGEILMEQLDILFHMADKKKKQVF